MFSSSLKDIYEMVLDAKSSIWSQARSMGRIPKIYLHWSAGHYHSKFEDYHVNIDDEGRYFVTTTDFSIPLAGTWKRNTGAINLSLCCAYNATSYDLGPEPPTQVQIECMSMLIATCCAALNLEITKTNVLTHGEAADNEDGIICHENYGPKSTVERWDLEFLQTRESPRWNPWATDGSRGGDVLRGKANWYLPYVKKEIINV